LRRRFEFAMRVGSSTDVLNVIATTMTFTDFGIESVIELIKIHKDDPTLAKRWRGEK